MNTVQVSSLIKQFIVNHLVLPYDMRQLINGFCFYDAKTWELMEFIKKRRMEINNIIKTSLCTRKMNCIVQHWAFGERPSGCQFQAVNCHYCGNYKFVSTVELFNLISNNAKCICSPEPFDIFEDDDGSMGEMWEPDTPSVQYTDYDYDSDF